MLEERCLEVGVERFVRVGENGEVEKSTAEDWTRGGGAAGLIERWCDGTGRMETGRGCGEAL